MAQEQQPPDAADSDAVRALPFFALSPTPEYYSDSVGMTGTVYTITLVFGVKVGTALHKEAAIVRMSPQHAKVMAILFKRQLKEFEQETGEIILPDGLLREKGIELGRDWDAV